MALESDLDRNDPETEVYFSNSIAAQTKNPYLIDLSVFIGGNLGLAGELSRGIETQSQINSNGGIDGRLLW